MNAQRHTWPPSDSTRSRERVLQTGRGAVVSRSSARGRAIALDLATRVTGLSGKPLVILESPAVHLLLRRELAQYQHVVAWNTIQSDELSTVLRSLRDCFVVANYAVAPLWTRDGRTLPRAVTTHHDILITLRPRDLALNPELRHALGHNVIDADGPLL